MAGKPTPGKPDLNRLRVRFGKDGRLAHLGHIEVLNTIMRSVRRAGLPFSVGNGFAQRMRIQFSQALPVGAASLCEYYDLYLTDRVDADQALDALVASTPTLLAPVQAAYVGGRGAALEAWLTRSHWTVQLLGTGRDFDADGFDEAFQGLRERGSISFMRGDKHRTLDLGSTLLGWELSEGKTQGPWRTVDLALKTRSSNLGALRPAVLIEAALGSPCLAEARLEALRVTRVGQWHETDVGLLVDPFDPSLLV